MLQKTDVPVSEITEKTVLNKDGTPRKKPGPKPGTKYKKAKRTPAKIEAKDKQIEALNSQIAMLKRQLEEQKQRAESYYQHTLELNKRLDAGSAEDRARIDELRNVIRMLSGERGAHGFPWGEARRNWGV